MSKQSFGGKWTQEKLETVRKYLVAYAKIMRKRPRFRFAYIDAFAGTGYRAMKQQENPNELFFPELVEKDSQAFLDGSARIALKVEPPFETYIFIERDEQRFAELQHLQNEFPQREKAIKLVQADANEYIIGLCKKSWKDHRAVLFLDPFGMQVPWSTIQAIANTKAIDLWYLFPLGVAVNRLLKKDGHIAEPLKRKLDEIFGEGGWYDVFYQTYTKVSFFGEERQTVKVGDFASISNYFVARLKTVFDHVADNPLPLLNSRNNPLYLLCFASHNKTAVKIAQDILKS